MGIMTIVSLVLGAMLIIGFLLGFWRSWQKSIVRFGFIMVSFVLALIFSSKLSKILMSKYVDGLVVSIFGLTLDFEEIAGSIAGDLLTEGSALTNFATALVNIAIKLLAFLIIFIALFVATFVIYSIISLIISVNKKKKAVGEEKVVVLERLIGSFIGLISTLILCMVLFTPVFGVMNVCDKFLKTDTSASASAYTETSVVAGKFYTENEKIGKVEGYLEKYDKIRKNYKKSFAGIIFKYTGVDAIGKITFNNVTTINQNGIRVNFTDECVNVINIYNIYKENFVKDKFDLATEKSVNATQNIYNIVRDSEVLRTFVVDLVPKMATKWSNGEKFLNMELPVSGDTKDIVLELLGVYKSDDFGVLDRNISVMFDVIKVANNHEVLASVNGGSSILDVIDKEGFVKDEINALATTPELKRALPNVMTTMVKLSYKSVLEDPGTKLDQEFTQEKLSQIVWKDEAELTQTMISSMFKFFDTDDIIDCLSDFGVVIDASRKSKILSKPIKILMLDYIDAKVTTLGASKQTLLNAINNEWDNPDFKYEDLFATIETTAKVAKELESMEMTDLKDTIKSLIENDSDGKVKDTIKEAINNGALNALVGDSTKAGVYEDILFEVLDTTDSSSVDKDLQAGQVIVDIINSPASSGNSVLDNYGNAETSDEDKAEIVVETLISSDTVMGVLEKEKDKGSSSEVKSYIGDLSTNDRTALLGAINKVGDANKKQTLLALFG